MEALNTPGVTVVPHNSLGSYEGAWLFMRGTSGIVSCPRKWVTRVQTAVSGASATSLQDPSLLSRLFGEEVTGMIGPSYQGGYLEPTEFCADRHHPVRSLSASERPMLNAGSLEAPKEGRHP